MAKSHIQQGKSKGCPVCGEEVLTPEELAEEWARVDKLIMSTIIEPTKDKPGSFMGVPVYLNK